MKLRDALNEQSIKIRGVEVGDRFKNPTNKTINEVVDILEQRSLVSGKIVDYICIAKGVTGVSTNTYDVPFSTVIRNKIQ